MRQHKAGAGAGAGSVRVRVWGADRHDVPKSLAATRTIAAHGHQVSAGLRGRGSKRTEEHARDGQSCGAADNATQPRYLPRQWRGYC